MSSSGEFKFSLRVMVIKEKDKVAFAEVDSDFADVLLSFLTLPLGTIVRQMRKHFADQALTIAPTIGSLNTLYQGLESLDSSHFCSDMSKTVLIRARNSLAPLCRKLKINVDDTETTKYVICKNWFFGGPCSKLMTMHKDGLKCSCSKILNSEIPAKRFNGEGRAFTKGSATFIISDELQLLPSEAATCVQILHNLGITDTGELEERTFTAGIKEIMDLLWASVVSSTPLTDVILQKSTMASAASVMPPLPPKTVPTENSDRKMIIKAIVRKSTNKVLLAQAEEGFIDFLFSLLALPLGRACFLLGNTCVGSIDNLHRSLKDLDGARYLITSDLHRVLLQLRLPPEYICKSQMLCTRDDCNLTNFSLNLGFWGSAGTFSYVKGPKTFTITDDLVVTHTSSLSIIKSLKTPLSDVEELSSIEIGRNEALNILRASLTSTSALTEGLKPFLERHVKQEKTDSASSP